MTITVSFVNLFCSQYGSRDTMENKNVLFFFELLALVDVQPVSVVRLKIFLLLL